MLETSFPKFYPPSNEFLQCSLGREPEIACTALITGRHSTEDLLGGKRVKEKKEEEGKSQNISWGEAGGGEKPLLPLDKGENYFYKLLEQQSW